MSEKLPKSGAETFRLDVVGLRAFAVLFVMLHHFNIPGFGGAFYGPDIFFVLSGYLITGSLVNEYKRNLKSGSPDGYKGWSWISFRALYLRRARRILPAGILVIVATYAYAAMHFNSLRVGQIRSDAIWTLFFGANITFLRQGTDYFSQGYVSPLVHFWSLSVTEQFYFVWPALFVAAANSPTLVRGRRSRWRKRVIRVFTIVAVLSFIWMLISFQTNQIATYFSTFARGWELAIGGLICFMPLEKVRSRLKNSFGPLRLLSVTLLFVSFAFVRDNNFPYTVWVPVVATAFLLVSGSATDTDLASRVLGFAPLKAIGAISYSMYLWHWPIFVFASEAGLMTQLWQRLVGIAATVAISTVTYWAVERPCLSIPIQRRPIKVKTPTSGVSRGRKLQVVCGGVAAFACLALVVVTYPAAVGMDLNAEQAAKNWKAPVVQQGSQAAPSLTDAQLDGATKKWAAKISAGLKLKSVSPALGNDLLKQTQVGLADTDLPHTCEDLSKILPTKGPYASYDCSFGPSASSAKHKLLIVGGSFAWPIRNAILSQLDLQKDSLNVRVIQRMACPFADVKGGSVDEICVKNRQRAYAETKKYRPDYLLIADHANDSAGIVGNYGAGLLGAVNTVLKSTGHIAIIGTQPERSLRSENCLDNKFRVLDACFFSAASGQNYRLAQQRVATLTGQAYIDPLPWLCVGAKCPPIIDDTMVFNDNQHYSTPFAKKIGPLMVAQLNKFGFGSSLGLK